MRSVHVCAEEKGGSVNFPDIEGFLAVVRAGEAGENLSDAADDLHLSQSALTRRVQRLEEELGTTLFERHGRKLVLNTRGRAFVPHAHTMLEARSQGIQQVASAFRFHALFGHLDGPGFVALVSAQPSSGGFCAASRSSPTSSRPRARRAQ